MISWEDITMTSLDSTSQARSTLIYQCKRTRAITQVTVKILAKRIASAVSTTVFRTIRNWDATTEASTLIRTIRASMFSSTLTSSRRKVDGTTEIWIRATKTTLSRNSIEETLQMVLTWWALLQKTKNRMRTTRSCLLTQRTRLCEIVTSRPSRSHSSLPSTRQATLRTSLERSPRTFRTRQNEYRPQCEKVVRPIRRRNS